MNSNSSLQQDADTLLTLGNTAKLYCLEHIEQMIQAREAAGDSALRILDLGSGTSRNFIELLRRYPHVRYTGIEPSASVCAVARRQLPAEQATIITGYAYDVFGQYVNAPFDVVVSFSVFEHVYQRQRYIDSIRDCLKPDGQALINYDAGHFIRAHARDRIKNIVGPLLARVGVERYYQSFVHEADFKQMVANAGLKIVEVRYFNTHMKGIHKRLPTEAAAEHMRRWYAHELWLNDLNLDYTDRDARTWQTRNFVLVKGD